MRGWCKHKKRSLPWTWKTSRPWYFKVLLPASIYFFSHNVKHFTWPVMTPFVVPCLASSCIYFYFCLASSFKKENPQSSLWRHLRWRWLRLKTRCAREICRFCKYVLYMLDGRILCVYCCGCVSVYVYVFYLQDNHVRPVLFAESHIIHEKFEHVESVLFPHV